MTAKKQSYYTTNIYFYNRRLNSYMYNYILYNNSINFHDAESEADLSKSTTEFDVCDEHNVGLSASKRQNKWVASAK